MEMHMELMDGEIKLIKQMFLKLSSRFTKIEQFLAAQFGDGFEAFKVDLYEFQSSKVASRNSACSSSRSISEIKIGSSTKTSNDSCQNFEVYSQPPAPLKNLHTASIESNHRTALVDIEAGEGEPEFTDDDYEEIGFTGEDPLEVPAGITADYLGQGRNSSSNFSVKIQDWVENSYNNESTQAPGMSIKSSVSDIRTPRILRVSSGIRHGRLLTRVPRPILSKAISGHLNSSSKKSRHPLVAWVVDREFSKAEEAEGFLNDEGVWAKSFANVLVKGKQQYFQCRFKKKCPARRKLFYRIGRSILLYKTAEDHEHSGVNPATFKRLSNVTGHVEIVE